MKRLIALVWLGLLLGAGTAVADEYVNGYYKQDGTYVAPHYRSSPDSSYNNNWSVSPNVNPYTGAAGTRRPTLDDRPPNSGWGNGYSNGYNGYQRRRR